MVKLPQFGPWKLSLTPALFQAHVNGALAELCPQAKSILTPLVLWCHALGRVPMWKTSSTLMGLYISWHSPIFRGRPPQPTLSDTQCQTTHSRSTPHTATEFQHPMPNSPALQMPCVPGSGSHAPHWESCLVDPLLIALGLGHSIPRCMCVSFLTPFHGVELSLGTPPTSSASGAFHAQPQLIRLSLGEAKGNE